MLKGQLLIDGNVGGSSSGPKGREVKSNLDFSSLVFFCKNKFVAKICQSFAAKSKTTEGSIYLDLYSIEN